MIKENNINEFDFYVSIFRFKNIIKQNNLSEIAIFGRFVSKSKLKQEHWFTLYLFVQLADKYKIENQDLKLERGKQRAFVYSEFLKTKIDDDFCI